MARRPSFTPCDPHRRFASFAGSLDLAQLWRLLAHARLLVAPDTGVAHLARVVGVPTVALFGPGSAVITGAGEFWRNAPYRAVTVDPFPCRDQSILFRREIEWVRRCARHAGAMSGAALHAGHIARRRDRGRGRSRRAGAMTGRPTIVQINLSPTLGGAEVFTAFMSRALAARGWPTRTIVDAAATFWRDLDFGGVEPVRVRDAAEMLANLAAGDIALIHGPLPAQVLAADARARAALRPRAPGPLRCVAAGLLRSRRPHVRRVAARHQDAAGQRRRRNVHDEPLYGMGEIERRHPQATPLRGPLCEWDEHKLRDRMLALGERRGPGSAARRAYARRPGLTLGIVSRIAPLKQFPALFDILAPIIAAQPAVNVEVFGVAVGYKALRELRAALRPLGTRVRFWGHQRDVAPAYRGIDYLLTGLPEREALGLNVIESCLCGTPVLAVDAPPFTETMRDGVTGFLYTDPRRDQGRHFGERAGRHRRRHAQAGPGAGAVAPRVLFVRALRRPRRCRDACRRRSMGRHARAGVRMTLLNLRWLAVFTAIYLFLLPTNHGTYLRSIAFGGSLFFAACALGWSLRERRRIPGGESRCRRGRSR